jgi:hypothetical protein
MQSLKFVPQTREVEEIAEQQRAEASTGSAEHSQDGDVVTQTELPTLWTMRDLALSWIDMYCKDFDRAAARIRDGATTEPGRYKGEPSLGLVIDSRPDVEGPDL